jgi:hypothetical protein
MFKAEDLLCSGDVADDFGVVCAQRKLMFMHQPHLAAVAPLNNG